MAVSTPIPGGTEPQRTEAPAVGYMPALDGLRALAVLAVVAYHGGLDWLPGGFLGVEVFFVLSGYLITALLLAEREATGGTAWVQFWIRRARRLLPALFVVLAAVAAVWVVVRPDEVARLRGDLAAAFVYGTNWFQIIVQQSYFDAMGPPSPLRHLWSLAIEEQFYVVWPLALAVLVRVTRGRRRSMARATIVLAAVSAVWAMVLFTPGSDPSRVYYGTDTRATGVLLGAALAILAPPWRMRAVVDAGARRSLTAIGAAGLLGIVALMAVLDEYDAFVYRGGFVVLDLCTLAAIIGLVHPARTLVSRILALRPLVWIGRRSYGIYLWNWPIFMLLSPMAPLTTVQFAIGTALTFAIAALSYHFVEMPVRDGALLRWWAGRAERGALFGERTRRPVAIGALVAAVVTALVLTAGAPVSRLDGVDLTGVVTDSLGNVLDEVEPTTTTTVVPATTTSRAPVVTVAPAPTTTVRATGLGSSTIAIGDSVLLGARNAVRAALPGVTVNAVEGRQFGALNGLLASLSSAGSLRANVVIHLGTNGAPTTTDLRKVLDRLASVRRVVLVNTTEDRPWQETTNARLAAAVKGRPNVVLADWNARSAGRSNWFVADGIHLSPAGAAAYASMLVEKLK